VSVRPVRHRDKQRGGEEPLRWHDAASFSPHIGRVQGVDDDEVDLSGDGEKRLPAVSSGVRRCNRRRAAISRGWVLPALGAIRRAKLRVGAWAAVGVLRVPERGSRQGSRGRKPTRVYETLGTQERSPTRVNATRGEARKCIGRKRTTQIRAPLRHEMYRPKADLIEQSSSSCEARVPNAPIAPLTGVEVARVQPTAAYHNGKSGRLPGVARQRDCPARNNTRLALAGVQEEPDKAERANRFHERRRLHLLADGHVGDRYYVPEENVEVFEARSMEEQQGNVVGVAREANRKGGRCWRRALRFDDFVGAAMAGSVARDLSGRRRGAFSQYSAGTVRTLRRRRPHQRGMHDLSVPVRSELPVRVSPNGHDLSTSDPDDSGR